MTGRRLPFLKTLLVLVVLGAASYFARSLWLPVFGYALIHDDGPAKADCAVVLAGDYWGNRVLRGGELVRQGYVPLVLVSGPAGFYGFYESDAAIQFAVGKGYPKEWFIPLPHSALSTRAEARYLIAELKRRNLHSFLLVTSDFHTGRARRLFLAAERESGGGADMRTVAARDQFFRASDWWRSRQAQKIVMLEWTKTLATAAGM